MSVKVTVKNNMRVPDFSGVVDSKLIQEAQVQAVQNEIKPLIASGNSPVRTHGRLPGYADTNKYPGGKKTNRPVNLTLSGAMLREYGAFRAAQIKSFFIGIFPSASSKIKSQAIGNNYGESGAPVRRFIPASGETFKVSVVLALRKVFSEAIERVLRKQR